MMNCVSTYFLREAAGVYSTDGTGHRPWLLCIWRTLRIHRPRGWAEDLKHRAPKMRQHVKNADIHWYCMYQVYQGVTRDQMHITIGNADLERTEHPCKDAVTASWWLSLICPKNTDSYRIHKNPTMLIDERTISLICWTWLLGSGY